MAYGMKKTGTDGGFESSTTPGPESPVNNSPVRPTHMPMENTMVDGKTGKVRSYTTSPRSSMNLGHGGIVNSKD